MTKRVVLDTNVLVSGLLGGASVPVLRAWRAGKLIIVLSPAIYAEYEEVLQRPKFKLPRWLVQEMLAFIREQSEWVEPLQLYQAARDPADNKFLEAAVCGQVDLLISADQDLLTLKVFAGIPIVAPWTLNIP